MSQAHPVSLNPPLPDRRFAISEIFPENADFFVEEDR
jgi:hypothetical protein